MGLYDEFRLSEFFQCTAPRSGPRDAEAQTVRLSKGQPAVVVTIELPGQTHKNMFAGRLQGLEFRHFKYSQGNHCETLLKRFSLVGTHD